ncbi:hypothetical protein AWC05_17670 [Mycobacterium florentinum]|uniref:Uncharacterized protein n=1 Tax=Mycobacterium florentinum TaxID=292462 RepID=A0A1X1UCL7_MYCFL|nr:hypothetical protein [Mycobacterium florentinum]MCV7412445.1 hypothetical protein [Mycobacterium florentinum]ORV54429.1 hypothetical protein AWC05_17670 [Mycobacterium florentinum]BBX81827.1 hypothetical protein MFLOJ_56140 [Mycobacterium florentinum]
MTATTLAWDQPPWGITTPATPQTIITVVLALAVAGFVLAALAGWRRTKRPTFLLLLAGGYICSFNEPLIDFLCHCFFPADGWIGHTVFNRSIPIWVILAYVVFYGGLTYVLSVAFTSGVTRRALWISIGIWGALNLAMEIPLLQSNLYVYYGDQPFVVGGFPLSQLVFNAFGSLLGAVAVTRFSWFFTGARQLLLLLVPFVTFMSSWAVGMPLFLVLGTDATHGLRMIAAVVSMSLGLVGIDTLIRLGTGQLRRLTPVVALPDTGDKPSGRALDRSAVDA